MTATPEPIRPAQALVGLTVDGGWTITAPFTLSESATGSTFSCAYRVERDLNGSHEVAFLKALDLARLLETGARMIEIIRFGVSTYEHERDIVLRCSQRRMSNVVRGIDAGYVDVPHDRFDTSFQVLESVPYIIFEQADGDVRAAIERRSAAFDEAWSMRMLHGVANGIRQLHQHGIIHQDLKPSNVMTFEDEVAKVGDLGRACDAANSEWFTDGEPGDPTYWPPELHYGFEFGDAEIRRRAYDLYHVGSMAVFLVCGAGLTALLNEDLPDEFHWRTWPRTYENVQPYVRDAFNRILERMAEQLTDDVRDPLLQAIRELCDPNPPARGNPKRTDKGRYQLDRYVSIFNRLAVLAEHRLTAVI